MKNSNKYIDAITENVCSICVDSDEGGNCTLTNKELCAAKVYLDKIVEIVHNSKTDDIYELNELLRNDVCAECKTSIDKHNCNLRDDANCALDRYFSLIVETIHKVDKSLLH